jgi:lipid A 3-O-deacylase
MRFIQVLSLALLIGCAPGKWTFKEENDYFSTLNWDSEYTQGVSLEHEANGKRWAVGQKIYTPRHKWEPVPIPGERPYSALFHVEHSRTESIAPELRLDYGLTVGLVGPGALGKEAQCGVHALLGQRCPAAWHTQLDNEPVFATNGALITQDRTSLLGVAALSESSLGVTIGTLETSASGAYMTRGEFGRYHVAAGPRTKLVLRDITLDGNTFQDSPRVDKHHVVNSIDAELGAPIVGR